MPSEVIYFVSDTHLGDGSAADRFRYPDQLLDLLDRIAAEPRAQLVLLGDIMELWAFGMESVMIRHAPILTALGRLSEKHPVHYVVGNHDCLPWYYFLGKAAGGIRITERFTAARGALVALHGHQYDPFNRVQVAGGAVKVPWTRRLVQAVGFLGRVGGDATSNAIADAGDTLERLVNTLEQLTPDWKDEDRRHLGAFLGNLHQVWSRESPGERGYPPGEKGYQDGAHALMRQGARYVVMGHTHHPLVAAYGVRMYVNTGSWVWDRYPPTYARFVDGVLELLDATSHKTYGRT